MAKEVNKKENKKEEKNAKNSSNVKGMRAELKKVTWPTRKELINSTTAVIVIVIITAIIVFFLDVVFESLSTYGINKLRTIVSDKVNNEVITEPNVQEVELNTNTEDSEESDNVVDDTNNVSNETTNAITDTTTDEVDAVTETPTTEE